MDDNRSVRTLFYALLVLTPALRAQTPKPVLRFSARVGPDLADGSIILPTADSASILVGVTRQSPPSLYTAKLNADGQRTCANTVVPTDLGTVEAAALATDGGIIITGASSNRGLGLATQGVIGENSAPRYVAKLTPCGAIQWASYIPESQTTFGGGPLSVAADGTIYLAIRTYGPTGKTTVLAIHPQGRSILARREWLGDALAISLDSRQQVHLAGVRDNKASYALFPKDLSAPLLDVVYSNTALSYGTALLPLADGSVWIAGAATDANAIFLPDPNAAPPDFTNQNMVATLTLLNPSGTVVSARQVEALGQNTTRIPSALFQGPDGRLWMAIAGRQLTLWNGATLVALTANGFPLPRSRIVVPGSSIRPSTAISQAGDLYIASAGGGLPATSDASDSEATAAASVFSFSTTKNDAPDLTADRASLQLHRYELRVDGALLPGPYPDSKTLALSADGRANTNFYFAALSEGTPLSSADSLLKVTSSSNTLPANLEFTSRSFSFRSAYFVAFAKGAQGILIVPISGEISNAFASLNFFPIDNTPAGATAPIETTLRFTFTPSLAESLAPRIEYKIESLVSWLKLNTATVVFPASIPVTVLPGEFTQSNNQAAIRFTAESQFLNLFLRPAFYRTSAPPAHRLLITGNSYSNPILVPDGIAKVDIPLTITSGDSTPIAFQLAPENGILDVQPRSGTTPRTVTVTVEPSLSTNTGFRLSSLFIKTAYESFAWSFDVRRGVASSQPDFLSTPPPLSPGQQFTYSAGTSRCSAAAPQPAPWPLTLGGCTLRYNDVPIPLGGITKSEVYLYNPVYYVQAQLPFDAKPGGSLIMEDNVGKKAELQTAVRATNPLLLSPYYLKPNPVRTGDTVTFNVTGAGLPSSPLTLGDVAHSDVAPLIPLKVSVGGREAVLLSSNFSKSIVGAVELRVAVPPLAADQYPVTVESDGRQISLGIWDLIPRPASIAAVQHGASFTANRLTPGGIFTVYGSGLGPAEVVTGTFDASGRLPFQLAGTSLLVNGTLAPILYTSSNQLSAIAPMSLDGAETANVSVGLPGLISTPLAVPVMASDPGLFTLNRNGVGPIACLNQDGTLNSSRDPASSGSIVALYAAGLGVTSPILTDGALTSATNPAKLRDQVTVNVGGKPAPVIYSGPAPGAIAGLYQINIEIPAGLAAGPQEIIVKSVNATSPTGVTIAVR